MKILVVSYDIGKSAAGLVNHVLLKELVKLNPETMIICYDDHTGDFETSRCFSIKQGDLDYNRYHKLLLVGTGRNFKALSFVKKGLQISRKILVSFSPDVVLTITSAYGFPVFELGYQIAKKNKIPLAIHSFDPLPSPSGWGENILLRQAIIKIIKSYYKYATIYSTTNETMLKYQQQVLDLDADTNEKSFVMPNPSIISERIEESPLEPKSFLYLGSLYNKRNPYNLIDAFSVFLKRHPDAHLYFVGSSQFNSETYKDLISDNIVFVDWTNDPLSFVARCGILIDIDADIPDDVFISSKLTNYIAYDRIIMSISPVESPARKLVGSLKESVVISSHDKEDILKALESALFKSLTIVDYKERSAIREWLKPSFVVSELIEKLAMIK